MDLRCRANSTSKMATFMVQRMVASITSKTDISMDRRKAASSISKTDISMDPMNNCRGLKTELKGLEIKVGVELSVSILFGLEVSIKALLENLVEVLMRNSFVFVSCVWCGVAFLRGLGGTLPIQMRDYHCY